MPRDKKRLAEERSFNEVWLARAGFLIALGVSVFLAWNSLAGGGIPGCGPESSCDKVLTSRWAYLLGLPISLVAIPVYLALLACVRKLNTRWSLAAPLALLVIASATWFVGIQAFAVRGFCKFCMTAHAAGVFASLLILRRADFAGVKPIALFAAPALGVLAVALAQSFTAPPAAKQVIYQPPATVPQQAAPPYVLPAATNTPPPTPPPHPTFSIIEGEFVLDLTQVPVAGPLSAPKRVAKLFDYTCHHCRDLHHLLRDFRARHSNELAVVSLPLPLDSTCNPIVKRTPTAHLNACEYARYGLAVFYANPAKFEEFTDWIYANARPPELGEALKYARQLAGPEKFDAAMRNPAVDDRIRTDIEIYKAAYRRSRSGALPQMYFEKGASIGAVETAEALNKIMRTNLGLE